MWRTFNLDPPVLQANLDYNTCDLLLLLLLPAIFSSETTLKLRAVTISRPVCITHSKAVGHFTLCSLSLWDRSLYACVCIFITLVGDGYTLCVTPGLLLQPVETTRSWPSLMLKGKTEQRNCNWVNTREKGLSLFLSQRASWLESYVVRRSHPPPRLPERHCMVALHTRTDRQTDRWMMYLVVDDGKTTGTTRAHFFRTIKSPSDVLCVWAELRLA